MKNILSLLIIMSTLSLGCSNVESYVKHKYADYPKICHDYLKTEEGKVYYQFGEDGIDAIMKHCKSQIELGETDGETN